MWCEREADGVLRWFPLPSRCSLASDTRTWVLKCALSSGGGFHLLWWGFWGRYEVPDLPQCYREGGEIEGAARVYVGEDLQGALDGSLVGFDPFFYALVGGFVFRSFAEYLRGEGGLLVVDVVAQGRAREGAPAVVAGERLYVAAQPVELQPVTKDEVDGRGRIQRLSCGVGHVGNIQRGEQRAEVRGPLCQIRRHVRLYQARGGGRHRVAVAVEQDLGDAFGQLRGPCGEVRDRRPNIQRRAAVAQQPTGRPFDELAGI